MIHSIATEFKRTGGRPTGFDYLRIVLAVAITAWHTLLICYGNEGIRWSWAGPLRPVSFFLVPSFFALSGFLVAGSLLRNDILSFLTLRALRILPALFCEVVISAFLVGVVFTTLPLQSYFASRDLWVYLLNIVGIIHFNLPGVFDNNMVTFVNRQLWTIPRELECYIALSVLGICGIVRRLNWFVLVFWLATAAVFAQTLLTANAAPSILPSGKLCVLTFLAGVLLFLAQERIPFNRWLCLLAMIGTWLTLVHPLTNPLAALPIAYLTIWLGLQNPYKPTKLEADYSYGIYLYSFPLQQVAFQLGCRAWYTNLLVGLSLAFVAAYLSWTFVERKVLARRKSVLAMTGHLQQIACRAPGLRNLKAMQRVGNRS